ncbi:hypothetical protein PRIPAC_86553 [Pristionchus pacificus]|uniref:Amidase n=1 Tax=Pristionchus pacificus TaxID=54126 RepID=A0A2A6BL65_PRIPA|nr:hypothetical protein PRIPAC_86553 [Pristionchus pacificus]|eukprot:PDM66637.1 amidase [Pristionchus pacificus]
MISLLLSSIPRWVYNGLFEMFFLFSRLYFATVNGLFTLYHAVMTTRVCVPPPTDDLLQISASQAARMIRDKEISSLELVSAYIRRIEEINHLINAVVEENFTDAKEKARAADKEVNEATPEQIAKMEKERPLLGVPFTIKDCMEVEGLKCTYGVHHRKDVIAEKNAVVVQRMLESGAICLCITNVPEVCMWWETVNTIYGRSRNPYDTRRITGGSSGGEASLVAAAGSLIGVGSDIGGSIRMPAFFNGVFGLKPTPGVIPLDGHLPPVTGYRTEMLRIGPICRYAADLPLLFKVMGGEAAEALTIDEPIAMGKLRVFYMEGLRHPLIESPSNEMSYALKRAVRYMEMKYDLAAVRVDFPLAHQATDFFVTSMESKDQPAFNEILADYNGSVNCALEMIKWLFGKSVHTFPALLVGLVDGVNPYPEEYKKRLLYKRDRLIRQMKDLLGDDGVLIFPSFSNPAPFHNQPVLTPFNFCYTGLFNALALPVMQCPMGLSGAGTPLGVQVVGSPKSERNLIAIAKDLEEGFGGWHKTEAY